MDITKLHSLYTKHPIVATDTRKIVPDSLFFALKGPNFNGNAFATEALKKGAAYAVIDEVKYQSGHRTILVDDVLKTLQGLARYHREKSNAKVIGLTGSNGKTTTKELLNAVLSTSYNTLATSGNLNNHIGVPLTLLRITDETELAIIEMGANHVGEIAELCSIAQPDYGYITNFGKAHLEGFGGEAGVIKGKSELYTDIRERGGHIFINADDPIQLRLTADYVKKFGYSQFDRQYYLIKLQEARPMVKLEVENTLIASQLIGEYNFENCAAAVLIGKYFNVPLLEIKKAIEGYIPENNRSQLITKNGLTMIMDAYNANPTSMEAALKNLAGMRNGPRVAILGDMLELGALSIKEHEEIAQLAVDLGLEGVYLFGERFAATQNTLPKFKTLDSLVEALKASLPQKATILIKGSRAMALERIQDFL